MLEQMVADKEAIGLGCWILVLLSCHLSSSINSWTQYIAFN